MIFTNYSSCILKDIWKRYLHSPFKLLKQKTKSYQIINLAFAKTTQMSTLSHLLYEKLSSAIDRNEFTVRIFIDLSKAFYTVNHEIILDKLFYYGIRGVAFQWFASYLSNRKQYVEINIQSVLLNKLSVVMFPRALYLGFTFSSIHKWLMQHITGLGFYTVCRWYKYFFLAQRS